jgi:hypothetical protein
LSFPSVAQERLGRIAGVAEHKGDALTFLVLDSTTSQVAARSELRSGLKGDASLRCIFPSNCGESPTKPILSSVDLASLDINPSDKKLPRFSPDKLMGRTFIRQLDDGTSYRAKILRKIQDHNAESHNKIKFLVELGDGDFDEIISYNTLCDLGEVQHDETAP